MIYNLVLFTAITVSLEQGFFGRVLVSQYGRPGLVCAKSDEEFTNITAEVICRKLGHKYGMPFCCGAFGANGMLVFKGTHTVYFSSSLYIINQEPIMPRTHFHCKPAWVAHSSG